MMDKNYKEAIKRIKKAKKEKSRTLDLSQLMISTLPEQLFELVHLRSLNLSFNYLAEIPAQIAQLENLEVFILSYNQLQQLPEDIRKLSKLTKLYLDDNQLTEWPQDIGKLSKLTTLNISGNKFTEWPEDIGKLSKLTALDISGNKFTEWPEDIGKLSGLTTLNISGNKFTEWPEDIGKLSQLTNLNLRNNQLTQLPQNIEKLKRLASNKVNYSWNKGLALEGNRFDIADEMYGKEPAELISYLLELEKGKKPLHEAKIIFVGDGKVGKTSLVNRLKFNTFDEKESQTNGIVIEDWELPRGNDKIKLHLWDFGGQQIMHASHKFFMTRRSVYVLVVEPRTEDKQGETALNYWLTLIRSYAGDSPIVVVLNKCEEGAFVDIPKRQLKIQYPQIVDFVETSCKIPKNIDKVEKAITRALEELKHLDDKIPASYFAIKEKLQQTNKNFIDFDQYKSICKEVDEGISEPGMKGLVRLLNDLGIMLNIPEHRRLEETQVLNPGWLTNGVYQIITSFKIKENQGRLTFNEIAEILKDKQNKGQYKTRKAQNIIIDMMEHFKLCYQLPAPDTDCYLIPAVLPVDSPQNLEWNSTGTLRFRYRYKTLPGSVTAGFIVRMLEHKRGSDYWRNGIVIVHEKNEAFIRADHYKHTIYIEVAGDGNKRNTLSYIRTTLNIIHRGYSLEDMAPEGLVPLDEEGDVLMPYNNLLILEEEGIAKHFVPELRKHINVKEVLEGIRSEDELSEKYLQELANRIARGDIEVTINTLYHHPELKEDEVFNDITLLSSRWQEIIKKEIQGTMKEEDVIKEKNKITKGVLAIISKLRKRFKGYRGAMEYDQP
jgi:small GTP-binding protein